MEHNRPLRAEILSAALRHTLGDRDEEYGPPSKNLENVATLWSAYLFAKFGGNFPVAYPIGTAHSFCLTAEDVAWLNVLQKIARTFNGKGKLDTYEDAAAYAAIAGEVASE